jgi:hypothetical protein
MVWIRLATRDDSKSGGEPAVPLVGFQGALPHEATAAVGKVIKLGHEPSHQAVILCRGVVVRAVTEADPKRWISHYSIDCAEQGHNFEAVAVVEDRGPDLDLGEA